MKFSFMVFNFENIFTLRLWDYVLTAEPVRGQRDVPNAKPWLVRLQCE